MISKINQLEAISKSEDKIRINEIIFSFSTYILLVSEENLREHIRKENKDEEKIKEGYNKCVKGIKELNNISLKYGLKEIYYGDFDKESIKDFIKKVVDEMFDNRGIRRR